MEIKTLISPACILVQQRPSDKWQLFDSLIKPACENGFISDSAEFRDALFLREKAQSTAMARGLAIPHAETDAAKQLFFALALCPDGLVYDDCDDKRVYACVLIGQPLELRTEYFRLLAAVGRIFRQTNFIDGIKDMDAPDAIYGILETYFAAL